MASCGQTIAGIDRPNNVDIAYGFKLGGRIIDIAVVTERLRNRLRIFSVSASGIRDLGGAPITIEAPMGVGLYTRASDGVIFAIVSPKTGPVDGYLAQYRLEDNGKGKIKATFARRFGNFSGTKRSKLWRRTTSLALSTMRRKAPAFASITPTRPIPPRRGRSHCSGRRLSGGSGRAGAL